MSNYSCEYSMEFWVKKLGSTNGRSQFFRLIFDRRSAKLKAITETQVGAKATDVDVGF